VADVLAQPGGFPPADRHEAGGVLTVRVEKHDPVDELTVLSSKAGTIIVPRVEAAVGSELRIHVHARDVMLASEPPVGLSALNVLPATVMEVGDVLGPIVDVALDLGGERLLARITRRSLVRLSIAPGRRVFAVLKSVAIGRRDIGFVFEDE
jgi:molybdate transport system ATP-binding protein